jgi:hypothetical protein
MSLTSGASVLAATPYTKGAGVSGCPPAVGPRGSGPRPHPYDWLSQQAKFLTAYTRNPLRHRVYPTIPQRDPLHNQKKTPTMDIHTS